MKKIPPIGYQDLLRKRKTQTGGDNRGDTITPRPTTPALGPDEPPYMY